ncbi:HpaII family restriction endonuclease [Vibrio sp. M250220]|uniref:HpaII family restriction endonuclease n=1 Tax=Vibrio sp. M250220 TaxID=3020894 RepID=UPI002F41D9CA
MDSSKRTFIDLFAGIGGFHLALSQLGMEAVFASEIDKHARETYTANHDIDPNFFNDDIRSLNPYEVPNHDILCAGFPCQPFSQAGHKKGFEDGKDSERGNLFFSIVDILEAKKPKAFILENVRGLVNHDNGNTFKVIQEHLTELNYDISFEVLKASSYGKPQHRPRIYIVGFNKDLVDTTTPFCFPKPIPLETTMSDIWEGECERKIGFTLRVGGRGSSIDDRRNWDSYRVNGEVKQLTPKEGRRMMGFPDSFVLPKTITQAMKQLGNSVCVDVVRHIGQSVSDYLDENTKEKQMSERRFNRGEWSELYAFLKLLLTPELPFLNASKQKLDESVIVLNVKHNNTQHSYDILDSTIQIIDQNKVVIKSLPVNGLINHHTVSHFLEEIKAGVGSAFPIPSADEVLNNLLVSNFKGSSSSKGDIQLSFRFSGAQYLNNALGIKSEVGGAPTLLNASSATNFIFEISGYNGSLDDINSIATKAKAKDRIKYILNNGCELKFVRCEQEIHERNLRLVDSNMPEILAEMLVKYYSGQGSNLTDLLDDHQQLVRVMDYLKSVLLGMFSITPWDGYYSSEGSILTRETGELGLYHVIKDQIMKEYLVQNTKLDTPSLSRHRFGNAYFENGKFYIKLNLQIRMK